MLWIVTPLYILAWALPHIGLLMPFYAEYLFILRAVVFWLYCSPGMSAFVLVLPMFCRSFIPNDFRVFLSIMEYRMGNLNLWVEENYSIGFPAIGIIWKCKYTPLHIYRQYIWYSLILACLCYFWTNDSIESIESFRGFWIDASSRDS